MGVADLPLVQPEHLTSLGYFDHGQQQISNMETPHGKRVFALKPLGAGEDTGVKGLLLPSHITNTQAFGGGGVYTLGACVVSILAPGAGGESTRLEEWRDPFNVNHTVNTKGRWSEHYYGGDPVGFGYSQWAGATYYQNRLDGDAWRIVMIPGNAYSDEVLADEPCFFTRPATLSATGDVTAHYPVLRDAVTNADLTYTTAAGGSMINPRHVHGAPFLIPDQAWRDALGVDLLVTAMPWSRYPTLGYGYTLYGINTDQFHANDNGPVDCIRFQAFNAQRAMNGFNQGDNKPPGNYPLGLPLQPNGTNGDYDLDKSGLPKINEGEASPADHADGEIWNGTTKGGGAVWIAGTRTVLWVGVHAYGNTWYGDPDGPTGASNGYQSSDWRNHMLFFDALDYKAVKDGTKAADTVRPYAIMNFTTTGGTGEEKQGVAYDADLRRIYVRGEVDTSGGAFDPAQRVHCYAVAELQSQTSGRVVVRGTVSTTSMTDGEILFG